MHPERSLKFFWLCVIIIWLAALAPATPLLSFPLVQAKSQQAPFAPNSVHYTLGATNDGPKPFGVPVTFTAIVSADAPPLTFLWDFGDGQTASSGTEKTIKHTYANFGTYNASVKASDGVNTQMAPTTVIIFTPTATSTPTLTPLDPPIASCTSPIVAFNATSCSASDPHGLNVKFTWTFGDNSPSVDGASTSHIYTVPNTYKVSVHSSDGSRTSKDSSLLVKVDEQPIDGVEILVNGSLFSQTPVIFTANIKAGTNPVYEWTFGDGQTGAGKTVTHPFQNPGTYQVAVRVHNSVSDKTFTRPIPIGPQPPFDFQLSASSQAPSASVKFFARVKSAEPVTFYWYFGDGQTHQGPEIDVEHPYAAPGKYPVVVDAVNRSGKATQAVVAYVNTVAPLQDVGIITDPIRVFIYQPSVFNVEDPLQDYTYKWIWGDGTADEFGITAAHTYTEIKPYVATVMGLLTDSTRSVKQTDFVVTAYGQLYFPFLPNGKLSNQPTPTPIILPTNTATATPTDTPTNTPTPTNTATGTPPPTNTATSTNTPTATNAPAPTATLIPTAPTNTPTPTSTATETATPTETSTLIPTAPTATSTETSTETPTTTP